MSNTENRYAMQPMYIGGIKIDPPLTLAPMAGQTAHPFRLLCRQLGDCGLVCTELISSDAIHYKNDRTFNMIDWTAAEHPFAVQLFGSEPAIMAEAARFVVDYGADIVDINMGCWVPKIARKGAGAALLKDVCTATAVVEAVVKAVSVPVTVKIRSGWTPDNLTAVPFAKAAEEAGVKAIAVHARTASQGFSGDPHWDIIRQVKETVKYIPIIGNGDVTDAASAAAMFRQTGCDAVMIGRGALGKPWIFKHIAHELRIGEILPAMTAQDMSRLALRHAYTMLETTRLSERKAVKELRGQLCQYHLGIPGAAHMRERIVRCETLADIEAVLLPVLDEAPQAR